VLVLFVPAFTVVMFYGTGSWGIRLFEIILKVMVGVVVISFFGVVFKMTTSAAGLDWGAILSGFIPDPSVLYKPSAVYADALAQSNNPEYWTDLILGKQRDVMITAAATAVGINMTFLLPYSMLQRGWDKDFRGLAMFDLFTGLLIPFMLATSCVVIASASQFHGQPAPGLLSDVDAEGRLVTANPGIKDGYEKMLAGRVQAILAENPELSQEEPDQREQKALELLTDGDRKLAAMLVTRDAFDLSNALEPLFASEPDAGSTADEPAESSSETPAAAPKKPLGNYLFGVGVLGMAISTIIILMLINGFVVCEMLGLPSRGWPHRLGCLLAGISGAMGPFLWRGEAKFWLAVPTSLFGMVLLPIAYITFFFMMNSKSLLGDRRPQGRRRVQWNIAMTIAVGMATFGSLWSILSRPELERNIGLGVLIGFVALVLVTHSLRKPATGDLTTE
jgi:hypothetical protein